MQLKPSNTAQWRALSLAAAVSVAVLVNLVACRSPEQARPSPPAAKPPVTETPASETPAGERLPPTIGPLAGGITGTEAVLWFRTSGASKLSFDVAPSPDLSDAVASGVVATQPSGGFAGTVRVQGLSPGRRYFYTPVVDGERAFAGDYPSFVTAPRQGGASAFRFVVLGDFSIPGQGPTLEPATFRSAAALKPDLVILGGDVDHRNPGKPGQDAAAAGRWMRAMYAQNLDARRPRRRDLVEGLLRRAGVAYLWDDHDYCCNDGDGSYRHKHLALEMYDEHFPSYHRPAPEAGIYQSWRWGQAEFFLLDGRFHRSPSTVADDASKTLLGREQKRWLKEGLKSSTALWKFVLSGSVFNPTVKCGGDGWCEYRTEGRELVEFIRREGITNVIVISGDIHAGAITDGTNSVYPALWEMAVPGADVVDPPCDTTLFQGPDKFGEWSVGSWGRGFGSVGATCWGFGDIQVLTDPDRVVLTVRDELGRSRVSATVTPKQR